MRQEALRCLRFFSAPRRFRKEGRGVGDYLLALEDALHEPVHLTVVGGDEQNWAPLHRAALELHLPGRIVERLTPGGRFPDLGQPAAFVCGAAFCSSPQFTADELHQTAKEFVRIAAKP